MKHRTIRKIRLISLLALVILGTIIFALILREESYHLFIKVLIMLVVVLICFESLKEAYKEYLTLTRERHKWSKELNKEELEIIEDAINLIKSVDENIEIAKFGVYKVKHIGDGWFDYDEDTEELSIFIPFDRYIKRNKDLCFMTVLHEILHSQNLKHNEIIFERSFMEGINQFLTIWLMKKYMNKYKVKRALILYIDLKIFIIRVKSKIHIKAYIEEVRIAKKIIKNSNKDIKEIFLNYINLKPEFFRSFVPERYLIK